MCRATASAENSSVVVPAMRRRATRASTFQYSSPDRKAASRAAPCMAFPTSLIRASRERSVVILVDLRLGKTRYLVDFALEAFVVEGVFPGGADGVHDGSASHEDTNDEHELPGFGEDFVILKHPRAPWWGRRRGGSNASRR